MIPSRCEVCEVRATHCCAGLDVPMLYFCAKHAAQHALDCPDVLAGRSEVVEMGAEGGTEQAP